MPVNITDVSEFTDPVTRPAGADPRTAAVWGEGHQALANRTRYLKNEIAHSPPRTRVRILHPAAMALGSEWIWQTHGSDPTQGWVPASNAVFGRAVLDLTSLLPHLATVTRIRALVTPGASRAAANRMSAAVHIMTADFDTPAAPFGGPFSQAFQAASTAIQVLDTGVMDLPIQKEAIVLDPPTQVIYAIVAGNDGDTNRDRIHAIEITYDDPGPRNL